MNKFTRLFSSCSPPLIRLSYSTSSTIRPIVNAAQNTTISPITNAAQNTTIPIPTRVHRMNESDETKRNRLIYQSRKRGILETDLLLSSFVSRHLQSLTSAELDEYDKMLDENDWDIWYEVTGEKEIRKEWRESRVFSLVQSMLTSGKMHRMPGL